MDGSYVGFESFAGLTVFPLDLLGQIREGQRGPLPSRRSRRRPSYPPPRLPPPSPFEDGGDVVPSLGVGNLELPLARPESHGIIASRLLRIRAACALAAFEPLREQRDEPEELLLPPAAFVGMERFRVDMRRNVAASSERLDVPLEQPRQRAPFELLVDRALLVPVVLRRVDRSRRARRPNPGPDRRRRAVPQHAGRRRGRKTPPRGAPTASGSRRLVVQEGQSDRRRRRVFVQHHRSNVQIALRLALPLPARPSRVSCSSRSDMSSESESAAPPFSASSASSPLPSPPPRVAPRDATQRAETLPEEAPTASRFLLSVAVAVAVVVPVAVFVAAREAPAFARARFSVLGPKQTPGEAPAFPPPRPRRPRRRCTRSGIPPASRPFSGS